MSIFGAAFDISTGRWVAFNEDTLTSLSEHDTEAEALNACRRYAEREMRRSNSSRVLKRRLFKPEAAVVAATDDAIRDLNPVFLSFSTNSQLCRDPLPQSGRLLPRCDGTELWWAQWVHQFNRIFAAPPLNRILTASDAVLK
jgi:hypothetical protein